MVSNKLNMLLGLLMTLSAVGSPTGKRDSGAIERCQAEYEKEREWLFHRFWKKSEYTTHDDYDKFVNDFINQMKGSLDDLPYSFRKTYALREVAKNAIFRGEKVCIHGVSLDEKQLRDFYCYITCLFYEIKLMLLKKGYSESHVNSLLKGYKMEVVFEETKKNVSCI